MPDHEPVISQEQPAREQPPAVSTAVRAPDPAAYERSDYERVEDQDGWLDEPEELPRRPRRRLLGTGANPIFLVLLGCC